MDEFRRSANQTSPEQDHRLTMSSSRNAVSSSYQRPSYHAPSQMEVKFEAVDRIQTQVSLNRASLEATVRDIKKATEHIRRLEDGFNQLSRSYLENFERLQSDLVHQLDLFKQQLAANTNSVAPSGDRLDDQTLEILTRNLSAVCDKANKVDGLELDVQLMKRKMTKLEEQLSSMVVANPVRDSSGHATLSHGAQVQPNASRYSPHSISHREIIAPVARQNTQLQQPVPEIRSYHSNSEQSQSGWLTGTQALKRNNAETPPDASPKRTKLAPLEPRLSMGLSRSNEEVSRPRTESKDSYADSNTSTAYLPFSHEESEESRTTSHSQQPSSGSRYASPSINNIQGRGQNRLPLKAVHCESRIGLPRTSTGWSEATGRDDLVDGQMVAQGLDGQYYAVQEYGPSRRGSSGSVANTSGLKDPYAHTKKTRTKPIRNSDGVLIRKDGKPDMRSQSSAANLRKVHARKEEQREGMAYNGTPESTQQEDVSRAPSTEAPASPSAVMLQRSESTMDNYNREDNVHARADSTQAESHDRDERMMSSTYPHSGQQRQHKTASAEQSPRIGLSNGSDESRQDLDSSQSEINTIGDRRHGNQDGNKENSHAYRPSLPSPVSMQFKQPGVSIAMLTKQEVA